MKQFYPNGPIEPGNTTEYFIDPSDYNETFLVPLITNRPRGKNVLLHAPSQTSKSTKMMFLREQLKLKGVMMFYVDASLLRHYTTANQTPMLSALKNSYLMHHKKTLTDEMMKCTLVTDFFTSVRSQEQKEGRDTLLGIIFDEAEALLHNNELSSDIRGWYQQSSIHQFTLVSIYLPTRDIKLFTDSPFNIQDRIDAPFLTPEECCALLEQYCTERLPPFTNYSHALCQDIANVVHSETNGAHGLTIMAYLYLVRTTLATGAVLPSPDEVGLTLAGSSFATFAATHDNYSRMINFMDEKAGKSCMNTLLVLLRDAKRRLIRAEKAASGAAATVAAAHTGADRFYFPLEDCQKDIEFSRNVELLLRNNILRFIPGGDPSQLRLGFASKFVARLATSRVQHSAASCPPQRITAPTVGPTEQLDVISFVQYSLCCCNSYKLAIAAPMARNQRSSTRPPLPYEATLRQELNEAMKRCYPGLNIDIHSHEKINANKDEYDVLAEFALRGDVKLILEHCVNNRMRARGTTDRTSVEQHLIKVCNYVKSLDATHGVVIHWTSVNEHGFQDVATNKWVFVEDFADIIKRAKLSPQQAANIYIVHVLLNEKQAEHFEQVQFVTTAAAPQGTTLDLWLPCPLPLPKKRAIDQVDMQGTEDQDANRDRRREATLLETMEQLLDSGAQPDALLAAVLEAKKRQENFKLLIHLYDYACTLFIID